MNNDIYTRQLIDEFLKAFKEYQDAQEYAFRQDHNDWELGTRNMIGWTLRDHYPELTEEQRAYFDSDKNADLNAATRRVTNAAIRLYRIARDMKEAGIPIYQDFLDEVHCNLGHNTTEERIVFA